MHDLNDLESVSNQLNVKLSNTGINTGNIVSSAGRQTNSQAGAVGGGGTNKDDNS